MVVPRLLLAKATAPRRLQSLAAAVHAEAPATSSVRSTVIVAPDGMAEGLASRALASPEKAAPPRR